MIPINKRRIGVCILLSIVTLGIYAIFWMYLLVKNVRAIKEDKSNCILEMLCLIFVPFYALYWFVTRGNSIRQTYTKYDIYTGSNQIACMILGLFGLHIVAFAIMVIRKNAVSKKQAQAAAPVIEEVEEFPASTAPGSAGKLKLHNVEPKTAAMIRMRRCWPLSPRILPYCFDFFRFFFYSVCCFIYNSGYCIIHSKIGLRC